MSEHFSFYVNLITREKRTLTQNNLLNFNKSDMTKCKNIKNQIRLFSFETGKDILSKYPLQWRRLTTGCQRIDKILGGGIPVSGITQIVGESSCGKTQLCLQLAVTVQYPIELGGFNAGAIYVCTEDAFPAKRIAEICKYFPKRMEWAADINFKDNIFVEHVFDLERLNNCLDVQIPHLLSQQKSIGILIIDSIAGIFRFEFDEKISRTIAHILSVGDKLKKLSRQYNIAVVCVNQVTTKFINGVGIMVPSLGNVWAQNVTSFIELTRNRKEQSRTLKVVAPDLKRSSCQFIIEREGIVDKI